MNIMLHKAQDKVDIYNGFDDEVDVRVNDEGNLVFSHDINRGDRTLFIGEDCKKVIAVNIKEDGILRHAYDYFSSLINCKSFFFFDMSVPELYKYLLRNLPVAFRISEFETITVFDVHWIPFLKKIGYNHKLRFWVDCFNGNGIKQLEQVDKLLLMYPDCEVFIVSLDLHSYPLMEDFYVRKIKTYGDNVWVCTDEVDVYKVSE